MWEAILTLSKTCNETWTHVNAHRIIFPRLYALCRASFHGSGSISFPCLLPLLHMIPDSVLTANMIDQLLTAIWAGLRSENAVRCQGAICSSLVECCVWVIKHGCQSLDKIESQSTEIDGNGADCWVAMCETAFAHLQDALRFSLTHRAADLSTPVGKELVKALSTWMAHLTSAVYGVDELLCSIVSKPSSNIQTTEKGLKAPLFVDRHGVQLLYSLHFGEVVQTKSNRGEIFFCELIDRLWETCISSESKIRSDSHSDISNSVPEELKDNSIENNSQEPSMIRVVKLLEGVHTVLKERAAKVLLKSVGLSLEPEKMIPTEQQEHIVMHVMRSCFFNSAIHRVASTALEDALELALQQLDSEASRALLVAASMPKTGRAKRTAERRNIRHRRKLHGALEGSDPFVAARSLAQLCGFVGLQFATDEPNELKSNKASSLDEADLHLWVWQQWLLSMLEILAEAGSCASSSCASGLGHLLGQFFAFLEWKAISSGVEWNEPNNDYKQIFDNCWNQLVDTVFPQMRSATINDLQLLDAQTRIDTGLLIDISVGVELIAGCILGWETIAFNRNTIAYAISTRKTINGREQASLADIIVGAMAGVWGVCNESITFFKLNCNFGARLRLLDSLFQEHWSADSNNLDYHYLLPNQHVLSLLLLSHAALSQLAQVSQLEESRALHFPYNLVQCGHCSAIASMNILTAILPCIRSILLQKQNLAQFSALPLFSESITALLPISQGSQLDSPLLCDDIIIADFFVSLVRDITIFVFVLRCPSIFSLDYQSTSNGDEKRIHHIQINKRYTNIRDGIETVGSILGHNWFSSFDALIKQIIDQGLSMLQSHIIPNLQK